MIKQLWKCAAVLAVLAALVIMSGCKQTVTVPEVKDTKPPAEVTELKAQAGDGTVLLSWKNPADADLHQVEISVTPKAGTLSNAVYLKANKGENMSFTVEGLTNGKGYIFTVKTFDNALNESAGVSTKEAVKPIDTSDKTAPAEVTGLKAEAGDGTVLLSWKNPADEDLYQVEITSSPKAGTLKTPVYLEAEKDKAMSFTAEGLTNGIGYTFTVKTIDKVLNKSTGTSTASAVQPIDTSDKTAPAEITELKTVAGDSKISLSWKNPADEDLYQVEVTSNPKDGTLKTPVYLAAEKDKEMSFTAEGLTNGTGYTFTIKTIDKALNESAGTSTASAVTPTNSNDNTPPAEVTAFNAVPEDGKVVLSWKNPADEDLYQVEVTSSPKAGTLTNAVYLKAAKGESMSFTAEGLTNGTGYTFTVKTIDKVLNKSTGAKTLTAVKPIDTSDKTAPAEVTNLQAESLAGAVRLTWTDPADTDLWGIEISSEQVIVGRAVSFIPEKSFIVAKGQQSIKITNLTVGKPYTFTVKTIDLSGNKSAGNKINNIKPLPGDPMTIELTQAPQTSDWTNGNVTIRFNSGISVMTAKWVKGAKSAKDVLASGTLITGTSFEVTENGTYSVAVQDTDGRREVETIKISNIDKTAPQKPTNLTAEYKLSAKKIVLNWTDPADAESGIKELTLTYTVSGTDEKTEKIEKGKQTFEITGVEPQGLPYTFSLKGIDNAGNEGKEAKISVTPSEQAEVTKITVSRKKIEKNDPDKKVTVILYGFNLTKAEAIQIKAPGVDTATLLNVTDMGASAEFILPDTVKETVFKVYIKHSSSAAFTAVGGIEAKTCVCEPATVTKMEVTKQDGSNFETDKYGALKVEAGTGGSMKIVLTGTNLDIDGAKAGVRFNGQDCEGTANGDGTELTIENVTIPIASGNYPIQAQLKPRYKAEYIIVPDDPSWNGQYKAQLLRVLGEVVLKELRLSGYDNTLEGAEGWLVIKGENLDSLKADELSSIISSLGGKVTDAEIKDSTTLEAKYKIPDLSDNSVVDKTETLTIAEKTVSAPLHTLKIEKMYDGSYEVSGYHSIPSDGNARIPDYITRIGSSAFSGCSSLTSAVFVSPKGWAVYDDDKYKSKHADISETELVNAAKAAEYLREYSSSGGYCEKFWKKN